MIFQNLSSIYRCIYPGGTSSPYLNHSKLYAPENTLIVQDTCPPVQFEETHSIYNGYHGKVNKNNSRRHVFTKTLPIQRYCEN